MCVINTWCVSAVFGVCQQYVVCVSSMWCVSAVRGACQQYVVCVRLPKSNVDRMNHNLEETE